MGNVGSPWPVDGQPMFKVHLTAQCLIWMGACSFQVVLSPIVTFGPRVFAPAEMPHTDCERHRVTQRHMIWNLFISGVQRSVFIPMSSPTKPYSAGHDSIYDRWYAIIHKTREWLYFVKVRAVMKGSYTIRLPCMYW
jgi:hypothetical protein